MIRDLDVTTDAAGFPIVSWIETRGLSAPQGPGRARVECRIMKDGATGVLLFVARGAVREGQFEEGKPWEALRGFSLQSADSLYYSRAEQQMRQHLAGKGLASRWVWSDGAQVLLAEFAGDTPLHVNCAEASPVEIDRLHVALTRAFLTHRDELVARQCREMFLWPTDDGRVETYDPARKGWPGEKPPSLLMEAVGWTVALTTVVAVGAVLFWMVGAL